MAYATYRKQVVFEQEKLARSYEENARLRRAAIDNAYKAACYDRDIGILQERLRRAILRNTALRKELKRKET